MVFVLFFSARTHGIGRARPSLTTPNGVDPQMRRRHRRHRRLRRSTAALAVAPAIAYAATTISMSGATASFPLIELLTAKYRALKNGKVSFKLSQGGATVGIQDAAAGKVSIGNSSRPPRRPTPAASIFYPIAKYFVCVVTNPANPISNLTAAQVQQIFTGKVRDWSQVSGAKATGPIDVYSRTSVAGVLTTFQNTLLGGAKVGIVRDAGGERGPDAERGQEGPDGDRLPLRLLRARQGHQPGRLQRHRLQRRQRRLRHLPGRLGLLRGDEGAGQGRSPRRSSTGSRPARRRRRSSRRNWIPLGKIEPAVKTGVAVLRAPAPTLERPPRRARARRGRVPVAVAIVLMVVFVAARAWPTFSHEGLSWLGSGGNLDSQVGRDGDDRRAPARVGLSPARLAAALRHAADERLRRDPRPRDLAPRRRSSSSTSRRRRCGG